MNVTKTFGIHAVQAAIDYSADKIHHVWVDGQRQDKRLLSLLSQIQKTGIKVEKADRKRLDKLTDSKNHQGVVIEVELPGVHSENELKHIVTSMSKVPFFWYWIKYKILIIWAPVYALQMRQVCMA